MQTAVGVFGGENYTDGVSAPLLMMENAGHSGRPAVSSLNCPPFLAVETCREHLVLTFHEAHILTFVITNLVIPELFALPHFSVRYPCVRNEML
jgi:hypothetical protein